MPVRWGIKFVFSAVNDPAVLDEVMKTEGVTDSAGVPTVWLAHFQYCDANDLELPKRAPRPSAGRPRRAS